jgi:hypothetical protein
MILLINNSFVLHLGFGAEDVCSGMCRHRLDMLDHTFQSARSGQGQMSFQTNFINEKDQLRPHLPLFAQESTYQQSGIPLWQNITICIHERRPSSQQHATKLLTDIPWHRIQIYISHPAVEVPCQIN